MAHHYDFQSVRNLALTLAYDGTEFSGYARQEGQRTVQGVLEEALAVLLPGSFRTAVAGRTDRGVHALCQVVSCAMELDHVVDLAKFRRSLEKLTPRSLSIIAVAPVDGEFHARYTAIWRRYRYLISTSSAEIPHIRNLSWSLGPGIDLDSFKRAAQMLLGEHDFTTFCRRDPGGASLTRRVDALAMVKVGRDLFGFEIQANAFCHQMVRSLVGFLGQVALSKRSPEDFLDAMAARNRARGQDLAPPEGLFLVGVGYREPFGALTVRHQGDYPLVWESHYSQIG